MTKCVVAGLTVVAVVASAAVAMVVPEVIVIVVETDIWLSYRVLGRTPR